MGLNRTGSRTVSAAALAALMCGACTSMPTPDGGAVDAGSTAPNDAGRDAWPPSDAGSSTDAGELEWTRLSLRGGEVVEGELIATYDHSSWWWNPAAELTFGVFDSQGFAEWPDDRSMRFISSLDVLTTTPIQRPVAVTSHRSALRERGVVLERVPFDSVAYVITGAERYHLDENGYGDFAWDLARHDDSARQHRGDGLDNEDYYVWDEAVYLPTGGVVVEVVSDAPDLPPGPPDLSAINNLVGVQIYGGLYVYLLHLRQGSVPAEVVVGARLETGALIGRVGNSGVSAEPHLHVAVLAYDGSADPVRTWSVPAEWREVWTSTGRRAALAPYAVPTSGYYVSNTAF